MIRRACLYLFSFCILAFSSPGQTKRIDSLKRLLASAGSSTKQLNVILALLEQRQSLNADTFSLYANKAKELSTSLHDNRAGTWADYYIANCLAKKGELDSALKICDATLEKIHYDNGNENLYVKLSLQKGQIYIKANRYKDALAQLFKLLSEADQKQDTLAQVYCRTSLGWVNMEIGKNREALDWFYKAIQGSDGEKNLRNYGVVFSNMAATYNELNKNDSAEYFIIKAIAVTRSSEDLQYLANALAIQADIYIDTKRNKLAEKSLNEALEIRKQIGDPYYIVSDITQLAIFYASNNDTGKGVKICEEGIQMARKYRLDAKLPILYSALAENYKAVGKYKDYGETMQHIASLKDSLYAKNSAGALAEMEAKYEAQKKENIISRQKFDLDKKNFLFFGAIILMVFVIISALVLFNEFRKRQKLRIQIMLEKEKDMSLQAVARAEENERKRIAADLHDSLGAYAASIASNIAHLTNAPGNAYDKPALHQLQDNSRDMVLELNDTIWALKKDALMLTAISDRLKIFIQRTQQSYPDVRMEVLEDISQDHRFAPSQAFHLFQMVKESVTNALKHSGSPEIFVSIDGNEESWKITVKDNGKGIECKDGNVNEGGRDGIANMRFRAAEAGWQIKWLNSESGGTSVIIFPSLERI